jgi:hypothetical protein
VITEFTTIINRFGFKTQAISFINDPASTLTNQCCSSRPFSRTNFSITFKRLYTEAIYHSSITADMRKVTITTVKPMELLKSTIYTDLKTRTDTHPPTPPLTLSLSLSLSLCIMIQISQKHVKNICNNKTSKMTPTAFR